MAKFIHISDAQQRTLAVFAFLLYRMGLFERAARVYRVLVRMTANGSAINRQMQAGLAASLLETGDTAGALEAVKAAMKDRILTTREASLHLLRAQALWQLGRKDQARQARDEYLFMAGSAEDRK